ncbi:tyrosine-type recombinase/integrase [Romeriopsis navalis]|uniref:tyrosine-type recombinase/integrase n=1 Tax=Romeriopsis navalis TaxID=2992132 RepID=UPI0029CA0B94|nr:tyrosine-type recombinase/integrase [Romeriopsis navalis]
MLFLYRHVLKQTLPCRINAIRAKRPQRLPVVFTPEEVQAILAQMNGVHHLLIQLLYGSGLRLRECMQLRVKDIDFEQKQIFVRCGTRRITLIAKLRLT